MRASRLRLIAAAGITLATLALTACEDGTGTKDEGPGQSTDSAATADGSKNSPTDPAAEGTGTGKPAQDGKGGGNGGSDGGKNTDRAGSSGDSDDPESRVACNGSNTTVTVKPVSRPVNHMLITVKNTGSKLCDLTYYPVLRFDEMQWVPQPVKETQPQAVVSLQPGESGYAAALLSAADGSGDGGTTGRKLAVGFQGSTPNSDGGPAAIPSLPAEGVYYDSSLAVTYWQQSMDDALNY
ncbi:MULTISPECIES: DUF4232 domain-containing protein [unclassified Streptomyces]|uniref:DUF4232 domain-containing protein n=1 Tax=unclassified Streptomyces TaxID=2593676 RepID=UPI000F70A165|nr:MULTISPECIES: DUF4232 domain-containing protein [unclassified Streptomyces]AZM60792.1 hypothetical protein DLM49_15575 [Streptomyces sp. WAC 01438]RSM96983.1 hypothetical protein DMA10_12325 [Streptomyces sp. WAC 01420]